MVMPHWHHTHSFGQEHERSGERRTRIVIALTATMMVAEVAAGIVFGSMALLADGLHMASHAAALTINVLAYVFARRHAHDSRYNFGTGKMNALGGFTGAVLLVVFAVVMAWQSVLRLVNPVSIAFNHAIVVAVLGLLVNGASVFILREDEDEHHHDHHDHDEHDHPHGHGHDHNLAAAYLHVLADALTSVLAIGALLTAKYFGATWMDPLMGIVAAVLVTRWSIGLLRATTRILLDMQGPDELRAAVTESIEADGARVVDLHVWAIGPHLYGVIVAVIARDPKPPAHYRSLLPAGYGLAHVTIEVHEEAVV